ncbi:XRE family transcriptional regulator [Oceanidesulfovibrio marinus]|uniref:Helix-turn-helix transcriptional regulator n=1 Tax=Oceanidesulfovibrio marinus TaxID=370038 RepID=A0A6P1ZL33_9BACT|nr:helix-turn-helix transcriptional regulator [Oceanidesulfovibrio marinus]TVM36651.1 XRE family transcriptional regulator [Oceanidesulfovibrio marinus]
MENRCQLLRAWLAFNGISNKELAIHLGTHTSFVTRLIKGERRPKDKIQRLVEYGIPANLLPAPSERGPGRPRKTQRTSNDDPPSSDNIA